MKTITPPLKCQGIKTKLVPWIQEIAGNSFSRWIEPFMGSGVVGFNLNPKTAVFADSNPHIINFYDSIKRKEITPEIVKDYLYKEGDMLRHATEDGYSHYRKVRDRFNHSPNPLDFLFLSRAGFNGMMRFSKKGNWNIPFCKKQNRFAQAYITKIVNQVNAIVKIMREDWVFIMQDFHHTIAQAREGDLIYCDPPYLGRYTDYYNNWTEENERQLADCLRATHAKFILSSWHHNNYRHNHAISEYWSGFNILTRDHFYHAGAKEQNRNPIVEALICNFDISEFARHNHGIKQGQKQFMLLEQAEEYTAQDM